MTFEEVRQMALGLPGVVDSTSYGTPALKLGRRPLARLRPEIDALVVMIDVMDKEALIAQDPDVYFTTPHYDGYPAVLVHLATVTPAEMQRLLEAAVRYVAPPPRRGTSRRVASP